MKLMQKEINKTDFKTIQKIELEILDYIDSICRSNDIKYSLAGGTLIGAIRHNGFIPWDDDIDIMMTRNNYIKFCNIVVNQKKEENFYLVNAWNNRDCSYLFSKLIAKNTVLTDVSCTYNNVPSGVFVDIIPMDYSSKTRVDIKKDFDNIHNISGILQCRGGYYFEQSKPSQMINQIKRLMLHVIPKHVFLKRVERIILPDKQKTEENHKYVTSYSGVYDFSREIHRSDIFNDYIEVLFENKRYMCIKEYDKYLRTRYGEYMNMPPIEEQIPHHTVSSYDIKRWRVS